MEHLMSLMTRLTRNLLFVIACTLSTVSCTDVDEPAMIWDIMPISFDITVVNAKGENLADPNHPNTIIGQPITVEMDGVTYPLRSRVEAEEEERKRNIGSRAMYVGFYGFTYRGSLSFGDFHGDRNGDYRIKLHWPDGKTDELRMVNRFRWIGDGRNQRPDGNRTYYLNGKKLDTNSSRRGVFRFVR